MEAEAVEKTVGLTSSFKEEKAERLSMNSLASLLATESSRKRLCAGPVAHTTVLCLAKTRPTESGTGEGQVRGTPIGSVY